VKKSRGRIQDRDIIYKEGRRKNYKGEEKQKRATHNTHLSVSFRSTTNRKHLEFLEEEKEGE
jgi:hypothetical protein